MSAPFVQSTLQRLADILRPIRAMRRAYLPLLMVYFAYGALGVIDVSRDMWIKERLDAECGRTGGARGLAEPALDHEDGVRATGRLLSHLRLAAARLHADRGRSGGGRPRRACWRRRRVVGVRPPGPALYRRDPAAGARRRGAGRRRRRHVDGSRAPRRCDPANPPRTRNPRRSRHGPGARPSGARLWHPVRRRPLRLAGSIP